jgi:hypothetical protein
MFKDHVIDGRTICYCSDMPTTAHSHCLIVLLITAKVLRQRRKAYVDQLAKLAHSMQAELLRQKDFKPRQVRIILLALE